MNIITSDIINSFITSYINKYERTKNILKEHQNIVDQIINQNPKEVKMQ